MGGDLETNEDDNDSFSRVGLDALIATEKLLTTLQADLRIEKWT